MIEVFLDLGGGATVEIVHGVAQDVAVFINGDEALHLGTEGDSFDVGGINAAVFDDGAGGGGNGRPPILSFLLDTAIR